MGQVWAVCFCICSLTAAFFRLPRYTTAAVAAVLRPSPSNSWGPKAIELQPICSRNRMTAVAVQTHLLRSPFFYSYTAYLHTHSSAFEPLPQQLRVNHRIEEAVERCFLNLLLLLVDCEGGKLRCDDQYLLILQYYYSSNCCTW